MLRYPAHRYHAVPSPGFEPTTLRLRVRRPNHSATTFHKFHVVIRRCCSWDSWLNTIPSLGPGLVITAAWSIHGRCNTVGGGICTLSGFSEQWAISVKGICLYCLGYDCWLLGRSKEVHQLTWIYEGLFCSQTFIPQHFQQDLLMSHDPCSCRKTDCSMPNSHENIMWCQPTNVISHRVVENCWGTEKNSSCEKPTIQQITENRFWQNL
jgi:hypothetical protein